MPTMPRRRCGRKPLAEEMCQYLGPYGWVNEVAAIHQLYTLMFKST
jgi:hypothetical protein